MNIDIDSVRRWISATWRLDLTVGAWWQALADAGYAFPTWPRGLGGLGVGPAGARAVSQALAEAGVLGPPTGVGQSLAGPTLLAHGSEAQRRQFLPALASGAESWCQLFSEPGAGSDLASLRTSALRDGDRWTVRGQKVWSSQAHIADRGLLLARTDPDVPKRAGITYFVIDMDQPGVEVRPLRQMNGASEFCEVFLDGAEVGPDRIVGDEGGGWAVASTTLSVERASIGSAARTASAVAPGSRAGAFDRPIRDVLAEVAAAPRRTVSGFVIGNRALGALAQSTGRGADPVARQRMAAFRALTETNRISARRAGAAVRTGRPGPESSIGKLAMSRIARASRELGLSLAGPQGMLAGEDAPLGGAVHDVALASFGASIGGGTDEIQRNVIGERALGLPREPQLDADMPFRALRTGTQQGSAIEEGGAP